MIANAYSSTFDLARSYGLETIEFTHYSDAFLTTNGQSTRPDITSFFIQNDDEGFSFAIEALLANADSIENMTNGSLNLKKLRRDISQFQPAVCVKMKTSTLHSKQLNSVTMEIQ